nr:hypothetical protein [Ensifer adhaerens]
MTLDERSNMMALVAEALEATAEKAYEIGDPFCVPVPDVRQQACPPAAWLCHRGMLRDPSTSD